MKRENIISEWLAKPVYVPRSLLLLLALFVIVILLNNYSRNLGYKNRPIECAPCACSTATYL